AAFATISSTPMAVPAPPTTKLVEVLPIDADESLIPPPTSYVREELYRRGDTHAALLDRFGIATAHVERMVKSRVLHKLRPGTPVSAVIGADGTPYSLTFLEGRDVLVEIGPDGRATERRADFETRHVLKASVIDSSLFAAADAAGIPDSV